MLKGFRDFVMRGNVVDLAVALVIGLAFAAVINSFVADILTPLLGLVGVPDFSTLSFTVGDAEVRYGLFLNALIAFILVKLFRVAMLASASHVVVFHNHPSGDPMPSAADRVMTRRLRLAGELIGIDLMDHIILGSTTYFSFRQEGLE